MPGCHKPLAHHKCAVWCHEHAKQMQNHSRSLRRDPSFETRKPQTKCKVCAGMPWARVNDRYESGGDYGQRKLVRVVDEQGRCLGCGGTYAPEKPSERRYPIGSSAGIAERFWLDG